MDVVHVNVPLRTGKKMKKRKELDALVANSLMKRSCMGGGPIIVNKRSTTAGNGVSSQDQLLSESTDEQEAYWNSVGVNEAGIGSCNGKRSRNVCGGGGIGGSRISRRRILLSMLRGCTAVLVLTCVIATITVMWLLIDVREQITSLRSELDQVTSSSQGFPEALQKCHSVSRGLQENQTNLALQLDNLKKQLENFTSQVLKVKEELNQVQLRLKDNPELVNLPHDVAQLLTSVAKFGSEIKDLSTTVTSLKEQTTQHLGVSQIMVQNITNLQNAVVGLQKANRSSEASQSQALVAENEAIAKAIAQVSFNISTVNETLTNKLQWVIDDQNKDHTLIETLGETSKRLEGVCTQATADQKSMSDSITKLSGQVETNVKDTDGLKSSVTKLQTDLIDLNAKTEKLSTEIDKVRATDKLIAAPQTQSILPTPNETQAVKKAASANVPHVEITTQPHTKPEVLNSQPA